jgi:hypothetical protein
MFEEECTHCHAPVHCITENKCQGCHMEIARQRAETVGLHSRLPGIEKCQNCHVEHRGREAVISTVAFENINHEELSGFSLDHHELSFDGAQMVCEDCHTAGRFAADEVNCVTCHEDADGELIVQHSTEHGENCLGCHDGTGAIVEFDHATVYLLEGDHATAGCADCHSDYLFAGTRQSCEACHGEPDIHAGQFGQDCVRCHTAVAWAPAQLTRHRFDLQHVEGETLDCIACHAESYETVVCTNCHEVPEMTAVHPPETVPEYTSETTCIACHPTGKPGDAAPLVHAINPTLSE